MSPYPYISRFLISCQARNLAAGTVTAYEYHLRTFAEAVGDDWQHASAVEQFLADRRAAGLSANSVGGDYRALSVFFKWCVRREDVPMASNPMADITPPKAPQAQPRVASVEEVATLLQSIPKGDWYDLRDRLIITMLSLTGIRVGELCSLEIGDVDLTMGRIIIRNGKGSRARYVPLLRPVIESYIEYRYVRPAVATDWMLVSCTNNRLPEPKPISGAGIRQRLKVLCDRAGVRYLNPHSFRHGLAVHLLNDRGADMSLIQAILGHTNISTTARTYALWEIDGVAAQFERVMSGGSGSG